MANWRIHRHSFIEVYQEMRVNRLHRLSAEQNHYCAYCGTKTWNRLDEKQAWHTKGNRATIEHVRCQHEGGNWGYGNTVMACSNCNNKRSGHFEAYEFFRLRNDQEAWQAYRIEKKRLKAERDAERARKSEIRRQAWLARGGHRQMEAT